MPSFCNRDVADAARLFADYRENRRRELRNRLVELHRPLAASIARRYRDRGEPLDDLVQVAEVGLIKAVERYDPQRGVTFATYATPTIAGELKRHFRDATWAVSVSRRAKDLRSVVWSAIDELSQRLGRPPTVQEIAALIERSPEEVIETIAANDLYRTRSLDWMESEETEQLSTGRLAADGDDPCADAAIDRARVIDALSTLDERDRQIMAWRYFEECTQREIGDRLGIGQVQVSRLLRSALARVRNGSLVGADG